VHTDEFLILDSQFLIDVWPNPTQGVSSFRFQVPGYEHVTLKIYDLHGREVAVALDKELPAGEHIVPFDASDIPDGIYLIRLQAGNEVRTGKIIKR
jgi:hypothetical protein